MKISFLDCLILDRYSGTSQKGRPYGRLKFLCGTQVFEIFVSQEFVPSIEQLKPETKVPHLDFDLRPGFNGGVVLHPAW